jgi:hypothetical protein
MNNITSLLPELDKIAKSRITNERQFIVSQFVEALNNERIGTKYKPLSPRAVAVKLGHLKDNHTLYYFLSQCNTYKRTKGSFSKCFWGALKPR